MRFDTEHNSDNKLIIYINFKILEARLRLAIFKRFVGRDLSEIVKRHV